MKRYAEEANYWNTTVHPAKSKGEIEELLDEFGATQQMTAKGQTGGKLAWLIRFVWEGQSYRFTFTPLECKYPRNTTSFAGKKRTHLEQAEYQMGRIAVHFTKAILTAAEAHPHALFGFVELPSTANENGIPQTAGELGTEGLVSVLVSALPDMSNLLPSGDK